MKKGQNIKKIKKASVIGLVIIISLVMVSTSGIADKSASFRGIITSFDPPGEITDGSITIYNPNYGSITLKIAPDSLTETAIIWIYAAMDNGWPVEAFYNPNTMYLTALFIYPVMIPPGFLELEPDYSFNQWNLIHIYDV